jgi:hypothetical protein
MMCDLCKEHSDQVVQVASWQVCQWCVSHDVLDHALNLESDIGRREQLAQFGLHL